MSAALYSVINPVVKFVLRSPVHGLLSRNTLLLEFKGRKSGKSYTTPVSYYEHDGQVDCFTDRNNTWWRNLVDGNEVTLTIRGHRIAGTPSVTLDGSPSMQSALHDFLVATPRDAAFAGIALNADGRPEAADVAKAVQNLVHISIDLGP